MIKFDKVIIFLIVKIQQTLSKKNQKIKFPLSIKCIVMVDANESDNRPLRTTGRGGNGAPLEMRFSVKGSNRVSLRSAGRGGSGTPRTMDECEGIENIIVVEEKGGGGNGTLITAGEGNNRVPPEICFSVEGSNRASLISSGRGNIRAPRTMDECEGIEKRIIMEDKGGGGNGTLITADRGDNVSSPEIRFSAKGSKRAPPRSSGGGDKGALRTMDKCEVRN